MFCQLVIQIMFCRHSSEHNEGYLLSKTHHWYIVWQKSLNQNMRCFIVFFLQRYKFSEGKNTILWLLRSKIFKRNIFGWNFSRKPFILSLFVVILCLAQGNRNRMFQKYWKENVSFWIILRKSKEWNFRPAIIWKR